jgi:transcriptional regulator with XRE-family HTH domain
MTQRTSTDTGGPRRPSTATKKFVEGPDDAGKWTLTPNQVVAYNLGRARALRGWSQSEATAALAPYVGIHWSRQGLSQAERSITGRVRRSFDADELVAFARAFRVPIGLFFLPPDELDGLPVRLDLADGHDAGHDPGLLIDLVVSDEGSTIGQRLVELMGSLGGDAIARLRRQTTSTPAILGKRWLRRLAQAQQELTELAAEVEVLASDAEKATSPSRLEHRGSGSSRRQGGRA